MRHFENSITLPVRAEEIFSYVDDHKLFSSHMSNASWMMMGSKMDISTDNKHGKEIGSHIYLKGSILGIRLSIDEVVTEHKPPLTKSWKTVKVKNLFVVGHYSMKLEIFPQEQHSLFRVSIDYTLPDKNRWLGLLLGDWYARWCVQQMINDTRDYFLKNERR